MRKLCCQIVLAMQLLNGVELNNTGRQMVLTAVDYQKEKELFSQMKIALRNFFFALSKEVVLDTEA